MNKIALIGMPSAGKTTVGAYVAKKLGFDFLDLDSMVEEKEGKSLIEVMNEKGADYFRNMEFDFIKDLPSGNRVVISPAGSIIFQPQATAWIKSNTFTVFLDTPFQIIGDRLSKEPKAVAGLKERGLESIWIERRPVYVQCADLIVDTENKSVEEVGDEIIDQYGRSNK